MSDTPTPAQAAEKAIREALEAFPKGWACAFKAKSEEEFGVVEIGHRWEDDQGLAEVITVDTANHYDSQAAAKIADYIMVCNPEATTALLSQLAELRAEVERLRKNDARYRWLRAKAGPELLYRREQYARSDLVCGLEGDELDDCIDAALAADGKDGAR